MRSVRFITKHKPAVSGFVTKFRITKKLPEYHELTERGL